MLDVMTFHERCRVAMNLVHLTKLCVATMRGAGITCMSYHHIPPPGPTDHQPFLTVVSVGFPKAWVRTYTEENLHADDPIQREAMRALRPFWWSEAIAKHRGSLRSAAFIEAFSEAELGEGLAVPVFGPHGRNGYVGLGVGARREAFSDEDVAAIHLAAQTAHLRYCEMIADETGLVSELSERESEILRWIASGKSNASIAQILALSPNTVDTYTRRVFRKLGVVDRVSASLRGYALGLLD